MPDATDRPRTSLPGTGLWPVPLLVFVLSLAIMGSLLAYAAHAIEAQDRARFATEATQTVNAIEARIKTTIALLEGTAGLFAASAQVDRAAFAAFVERLGLRERHPGILGIGFSRRIPAAQLEAVQQEVRAQQGPAFRVWPQDPREEYHSIVFLEPLDERNTAALGFDMFSNPVRREAMAAARDSGQPRASGKVTLVQEIDPRKQAGFLIYLPIYAGRAMPPALEQRRAALLGFVYSPLRVGDLLRGVRGGSDQLDYELYDGEGTGPQALMHSSGPEPGHVPRIELDRTVEVAGRTWLVRLQSQPEFEALSQRQLLPWLGLVALAASSLLAFITLLQVRAKRAALAAGRAQEQATEELHREHAWLTTTLASIGDAVLAVDAQQRVLLMNRVAERLTGWPAAEARGRPLPEVVRTQDTPAEDMMARPGESLPRYGQLRLLARDGRERPIEHSLAPILGPDGSENGAVIVMRDVTERHRQELRNPLAPLRTSLQLLRRAPQDGAEEARGRWLDVAERQTQHMVRLIDDLLDVSRISRGTIVLQREPTAVAAILDAALETSRPLIEARGHRLQLSPVDPALAVLGDATRLAQVFSNLLNNAANYTAPGGEIRVRVAAEGPQVRISVQDNGIGIEAQMLPRVFEMFVQAHRPSSRDGGLGIGLMLVRRLVELHGGTVQAHSEGPGRGSEFTVCLPLLARPLPEAARAGDARAPAAGSRLRVLLVDDNRDAAESLAALLASEGHAVELCHDGLEALEAARRFGPDVVLLDIGLPGLDGYEVARRLRRTDDGARLRLIAVTGWGQPDDRRKAREAGFDLHLVKPIDYAELSTHLRQPMDA